MKRATALLTAYGAVLLPAIVAGVGFVDAAQPAGSTYELQVTGRAGVPASNVSAVVLNVTSAEARGTGFVTAWPCGEVRPNASNLNFGVGAPVANSAVVKVGAGGKVCLFTADSDTELIADVNGWFAMGSGLTSMSPARLLDTRRGLTTLDAAGAGQGLRRAGSIYELQVTGRAGVPATASGVVLNVTSAEARATGFVTAWPCGEAVPTASNLNFGVGAPVANSAIVKIGAGGKVCLLTADTDTELIADVNGWFTSGSGYTSLTPSRLLDTRGTTTPAAAPPAPSTSAVAPVPSGAAFVEAFTGNTGLERFRSGVFHRNVDVFNGSSPHGGSWLADHDLSCGAPTTFRTIDARNRADSLFMCKDHMMTTMGDVDGYSVVWFTPNQTFTNIHRVCWDVNLTNMGNRQWWEVSVQPADSPELTVNEAWLTDPSNLPHRSSSSIVATMGNDHVLHINATTSGGPWDAGTDTATRFQHCLVDNGNGTTTLTQQRTTGTASVTINKAFPTGAVKVMFKDHNYTPDKSELSFGRPAYTWHWDNIIIS